MDDPLYRKSILRLAADAAGAGHLAAPDAAATRHNPACGDRVTVEMTLAGGRIASLAHHTHACVLAQASAAILGQAVAGHTADELAALARALRSFLAGGQPPPAPFDAYRAFEGFAAHAGRHRCVMLPVETVLEALKTAESV